ncbi:unnamed protein product, partial [Polarella glacialis]
MASLVPPSEWCGLDTGLRNVLEPIYGNVLSLQAVIDDALDARAALFQIVGADWDEETLDAAAVSLSKWAAAHQENFGRMRSKRLRLLRDEVFIAIPVAASIQDAYQDRLSASLELTRKHFKSSLTRKLAGLDSE